MALPRPKKESEARADELRGIRNVKTRESGYEAQLRAQQAANNERFDQTSSQTVAGRFEKEKSIEAHAYSDKRKEKSSSDLRNDEEVALLQQNALYEEEAARDENRRRTMQKVVESSRNAKGALPGKMRKLSSFRNWTGIGVIFTIYLWQLVFALISLVGFGAQALVSDFVNDSWFGKFVSFFIDIEKYFPGEYLGWGLWGAATFLAIGTFLGYLIYYQLIGISVFRSTVSTLITFTCFSLSLLPVSNLFPWLLIWVVYINITSLFSPT